MVALVSVGLDALYTTFLTSRMARGMQDSSELPPVGGLLLDLVWVKLQTQGQQRSNWPALRRLLVELRVRDFVTSCRPGLAKNTPHHS